MSEPNREKEIFGQALELSSPEGRAAFVAGACAGDESLRERVHALLWASGAPTAFLPKTPRPTPAARDEEGVDAAGTVIGRYRLLERIGEGGFGVVYLAEQLEPVRRRVALKVIKPGMDSRQVIARFEAERQALALMDHPNIAQILDAGTIGSAEIEIANPNAQISQGRPYFVMELIDGIPITKFCEERQLDLEARLRLIIEVCFAVQHAHQKGVIHRDLKPSNILVARHGERHVPKVIDFGIAKAMQAPLTEKTVFTQVHQFMGTPAYMSPEQAAMGGLDIDTRSDIYSLGALLYELLAGGPPFDPKELLSGGLDELRKIIGEKEPIRPSARLTQALVAAEGTRRTAGGTEAGGSSRRRLQELVRQLESDLDWIVLKALEKDRDRRYATANGLAADLQRYLNREPVTAVAPTLGYQLAKFYRRNRKLVVTLSAFVALLLAASVVSIGQAIRAWRAEAVAEREAATALKVSEFLWKEVFKQLTPWEHTNRAVSLRGAFDLAATRIGSRLTNQPLAEASVRFSYGKAYFGMSEFASAETNLLRALELRRNHAPQPDVQTADLLYDLGILRQFQNRPAEAERLFGEAAALREKTLGANHRETLIAAAKAALVRSGRLPHEEAEPLLRHSLEQLRRFVGAEANITLATMNWLGALWADQGRFDEAFDLFSETHRIAVRDDGVASSGALWSLELMAGTRARQGRFAEADKSFLELISVRERVNGTNHVFTLQTRLLWLERVLVPQGRLAEAAAAWLEITPRVQARQPTLQPALALTRQSLLAAWQAQGGGAECEEFQRRAGVYPPAAPIEVTAPSDPTAK